MDHNFKEKNWQYERLEDVFCINSQQINNKQKKKKFFRLGFWSSAAIFSTSLIGLFFGQELSGIIDEFTLFIIWELSIPVLIFTFSRLLSIKEEERNNQLPKWERYKKPITPAITYALLAGLCLSMPTFFAEDSNVGCFSPQTQNNIKSDLNQAKDLPEGYYVKTI